MESRFLQVLLFLCVTSVPAANGDCDLGEQPVNMTRWSGEVRSPGFTQGMYPNHQNCTWDIYVNSGSRIRFTFIKFDLEAGRFINADQNITCVDYVKITDGPDTLFYGCGSLSPDEILSNSNEVTIEFVSDESGQPQGFYIQYLGVPSNIITGNAILETPGYPDYPPRNQIFEWRVVSNKRDIAVVKGEETQDTLPWCGESPVRVINVKDENWNQELCKENYAFFSPGDIRIIYNTTGTSWVGKLRVEYMPGPPWCNMVCTNSSGNLQICINGRDMSGRYYSCQCTEDYRGRHCEVPRSLMEPCYSDPCQSRGNCTVVQHEYQCQCFPGYSGKNCETEIDFCEGVTCQNEGNCTNKDGGFECECATGFSGKFCGKDIDECDTDICQNNGRCTNTPGSFHCTCPSGYKGELCEIPFGKCDWTPCLNGGTCIDVNVDEFKCACSPGYTGSLCSIPLGTPHCKEDVDTEFGSKITWVDTLADEDDVQPCPPGIIGNATRKCVHDLTQPSGGRWTRPDLGDCVSPKIAQLSKMAKALEVPGSVSSSVITQVTSDLANATAVVRDSQSALLYPGDLVVAAQIVDVVSSAVSRAEDIGHDTQPIAELFGDAVDNIVSPETVIIWRNTRTSTVGEQVKLLLTSTERLVENLVQHNQRQRRSLTTSAAAHSFRDELQVTTENLEFTVRSATKTGDKSHLPGYVGSSGSTVIELPSAVADIATENNGGETLNVYYAKFKSLAALLSLKEDRHNGSEPSTKSVVNSDVVSSKVLGLHENLFQKLQHPVVLIFKLKNSTLKDFKEHCVFMNMTSESEDNRWSTEGCVQHAINDSHVTCYCSHLTNFAILMDVYGTANKLDKENQKALSFISYIGGSLSILCCLLCIIVFQYFRLRSDRVRIHQHLAGSIICVQVVFLVGISRTENADTPLWACKTVAILLHYFLTAMFCWMLVEGIHLYVALVRVFERGSHIRKYVGIGWGAPLVIVAISVGVFFHNYGTGNVCWLSQEMLLVCFIPTVGIVVLINTVILVMVLRVMLKSLHSSAKVTSSKEEKSSLWMSLKATAVLLPLLGLTWTLGFLAVNTPGSLLMGYIFTYLFTILNSFQGVIFFVFHCLMNADVHAAYSRRYAKRKRLTTMTSNDITTLRRKKSSSDNDTNFVEPSSMKTVMDLSSLERHSTKMVKDAHLPLQRQSYDVNHVSDTEKIWHKHSRLQDKWTESYPQTFHPVSSHDPDQADFADHLDIMLDRGNPPQYNFI